MGMANCKVCNSPSLDYIEDSLQANIPASRIVEELAARGENISKQNISTHKARHWQRIDPMAEATEQVIRELEQEMRMSPATAASSYLVLIKALRELKDAPRTTAETVLKAAEAVTRITGFRTQQQLLLAYMQKAFPGQSIELDAPATVVKQLPPPE